VSSIRGVTTGSLVVFYRLLSTVRPSLRPSFKPYYKALRSATVDSEILFSSLICFERTPGRLFNSFFYSFIGMDASSS
jgi:hypothetical protein